MKKTLSLIMLMLLIGVCSSHAQDKRYQLYGVGFYNQENLFDTCHDEGKNDYDYLPETPSFTLVSFPKIGNAVSENVVGNIVLMGRTAHYIHDFQLILEEPKIYFWGVRHGGFRLFHLR